MRQRLWTSLLVATLSAALLAPTSAADHSEGTGNLSKRSFSNTQGTRTYYLYVPPGGAAGRPLMLWLHGCLGPSTMQAGHALAKVAAERRFALAYPVQSMNDHPGQCWNWYLPEHQRRGRGEPSILAGITTSLIRELRVDARRVYVGGYSAGGAMTTVLGATYPDLFAAIAPSAGAPYSLDPTGIQAYTAMGSEARPLPVFMLQGASDEASNLGVGRATLLQWLNTADLADDRELNGTAPRVPSDATTSVIPSDPPLPVAVERYLPGRCELAQFLTSPYDHLMHAVLFGTDSGLALQRVMMTFLLAHTKGPRGHACPQRATAHSPDQSLPAATREATR